MGERDRELLLDSLCYAIIDETDQTRRNKKYVDIYDEYASLIFFISLCVSHLNIFVYLYVYYLIMTVFRTIRIRFPLNVLFTEIPMTYCTCAVRYCTVLYCTYRTDANKMMNRLINCPTDCLIQLFVLSMRCDFLFPPHFFTRFFILLSLSDSICSIRYCYLARRF